MIKNDLDINGILIKRNAVKMNESSNLTMSLYHPILYIYISEKDTDTK